MHFHGKPGYLAGINRRRNLFLQDLVSILRIGDGEAHHSRDGGGIAAFKLSKDTDLLRIGSIQDPGIGDTNRIMRGEDHAPVQSSKTMALLNADRTPLQRAAVYPIQTTSGIGDANGESI